jgi:3-deoxy-D-manno-octulosonic-acid transferase
MRMSAPRPIEPASRESTDLTAPSIKPWLARQAYSLLMRLAVPAYLWRLWSRGKVEPAYRLNWPERLGIYNAAYRAIWQQGAGTAARPVLWLHAVSLGEARAAAPLIQALRAQRPDMRLLLTHGTATGREAGQALLQAGDAQTWFPFDTPGAVRRFLRQHKPAVGVLMETEVWPNVQHEAQAMGVPMVLANARLSDKSLRQGQRLAALMRPAAQALTLALAQTPDDARRLQAMGAPSVRVCGNVKFDMTPAASLLAQGQAWQRAASRPIVLAASTREGEEAGLLDAWQQLVLAPATQPGQAAPRLLIVPRHPQRFESVADMIAQRGLGCARRSTWPGGQPDAVALQADIWLGDTMGEMPAYFAAARVALLGGSFEPLGGQNLIEAAACGCPVVMGPSTYNFEDAASLSEAAGAAFRVQNWPEGVKKALEICHVQSADAGAPAAQAFAKAHRGAAALMARAIWGISSP